MITWDVIWPFKYLSLSCGDLQLRPAWDEDVAGMAEASFTLSVREEHFVPNLSRARGATIEETTRNMLQWVWRTRAELTADSWLVPFAVSFGGKVVGSQDISAQQFGVLREISTGSCLNRGIHGQGVGSRMRAMVLEFAFVHLGAEAARTGYAKGNDASKRISEKLGYVEDGTQVFEYEGKKFAGYRMALGRDNWQKHRPDWLDDMEVVIPDGTMQMLGGVSPQTTTYGRNSHTVAD